MKIRQEYFSIKLKSAINRLFIGQIANCRAIENAILLTTPENPKYPNLAEFGQSVLPLMEKQTTGQLSDILGPTMFLKL